MKILAIGHSLHPLWFGGEPRIAKAVLSTLRDYGINLKILAPHPIFIKVKAAFSMSNMNFIVLYHKRIISKINPDIVMLWYDPTLDLPIHLLRLGEKLGFRLIYSIHFHHLWCPRGLFDCFYDKKMMCSNCPYTKSLKTKLYIKAHRNKLDRFRKELSRTKVDYKFIVPSKFMAMLIKLLLNVSERRIRVIYNGVNTNIFKLRALKEDKPTLLFVGALSKHKGFHHYIALAKYLRRIYGNYIQVWAVGKGPLYALARAIGIQTFTGISDRKLSELYSKAWITIAPSIWPEPFHLVTIESLACGTPVVAYASGGIVELARILKGCVYTVPRGNLSMLRNILEKMIESRSLSVYNKCSYVIQKMFNIEKMISRYIHEMFC